MQFGEVPLAMAEGAILAHSVAVPKGRLRKGIVLDAAAVELLAQAGLTRVTVARLAADDMHEDAAALTLAKAILPAGSGLSLRAMGTGRVNIVAEAPGIIALDADAIHALNAADPMITLATVPPWQRMEAGGMVATVKIISYAVPLAALRTACDAGRGCMRLRRAERRKVTLIQTRVGDEEDGGKGLRVTTARVERLGGHLARALITDHAIAPLAQAIASAHGADLLLILTGSATSDSHDTAPAALRQAGGRLIHFGMPVDPGNLLFIGQLGECPVIGLPGCAKSPALNGADWVLERVICGVEVTGQDIAAMGVGGLLKEIPSRPRPREG